MASKALLVALLLVQLLAAYTLRWPLTTATATTSLEYQLGQEVIASENWRHEGALSRHFVPSRSIDQHLPEWGYRDDYWRDYLSQPPLSFALHYWSSRMLDSVEPFLVGKLLAHVLIAAGVLASGMLLYEAFGFGATLAGLTFLIWGQPFLVWFIDGYYATTPAIVCQLVLVSWCLAFIARGLTDRSWFVAGLLAYLGTLSEWIALFGNAFVALTFLAAAVVFHARKSSRASKAFAVALSVVIGSLAAEATTILLYGTKVGFAFYRSAFLSRVNARTGQEAFLPYNFVLIHQMETAWPPAMLAIVVVMALIVLGYAASALVRHESSSRRINAGLLLAALILGFGGAVAYSYRLRSLVDIHWWFTGTWAIGWMVTVCSVAYIARDVLPRVGYAVVCAALSIGAIAWNLSFINLKPPDRISVNDIYRRLGLTLPHDGYPLIVVDFPDLFGDYPFATAYLRRPVVRYNSSGDPSNESGDLLLKLGTLEDATPDLINRYAFAGGLVYVAYDGSKRDCAFDPVSVEPLPVAPQIRICRVQTARLLKNVSRLWSTFLSTTTVDVGAGASTFVIDVSAPDTSMWSAVDRGDFVTLTSPASIVGPGTATFSVRANPGFARQSSVTVAGQPVRIRQAGTKGFEDCVTELIVQDRWRALGGNRTTQGSVRAPAGCAWAAGSAVPWIALTNRYGVGDGQFSYAVSPNVGRDVRVGTLMAGGKKVDVVELGCPYTISAIAVDVVATGRTVRLSLTGDCTWRWTAVSGDAFIHVTAGASGAAEGTVTFVVAPNAGTAREGRLSIADYTVTVRQAGS